jgi:hypothetical protein
MMLIEVVARTKSAAERRRNVVSMDMGTVRLLRQLDRGFHNRLQETPSWFRPTLLCVVAFGAIVRIVFAISVMSRPLPGDASFFHTAATGIANGKGYDTLPGVSTATHPPVFPFMLAFFDRIGLESVGAQRISVCIVASGGIFLVGLVGRKVAGATVGLVAALIAATDPFWVQPSGILMSESVYLVAIPGMLLMAVVCIERATIWRFGSLGVLIATATLIRSEAIDFIALLGVPVILMAPGDWRNRIRVGLALAAGFLLMLTPWLVRNEIQLGGAALSTDGGVTLDGSYCAATFDPSQPYYGSFNIICALGDEYAIVHQTKPPDGATSWAELPLDRAATSKAEAFARDHLSDMPGVVVARELTVWGFGDQNYQLFVAVAEGRVRGYEQAGRVLYWVLLPFVILGTVVLARNSRRRFVVVIVPFVVVALNSAIFYGSTRMRMAAEPSLALFASIGIVATVCLAIEGTHQRKAATPLKGPSLQHPTASTSEPTAPLVPD